MANKNISSSQASLKSRKQSSSVESSSERNSGINNRIVLNQNKLFSLHTNYQKDNKQKLSVDLSNTVFRVSSNEVISPKEGMLDISLRGNGSRIIFGRSSNLSNSNNMFVLSRSSQSNQQIGLSQIYEDPEEEKDHQRKMETIFENEIDEALLSASSSYSKSVSSSHSQEADEDEINNAFFEDRKFIIKNRATVDPNHEIEQK